MRRMVLAVPLALALVAWVLPQAAAQETKSARGKVTAISADSITVMAGTTELKLNVDAKTTVTAPGGSTATRSAAQSGKPGPALVELIKVGDAVDVRYHEAGMHAASIRKISSAGSGGGSTSEESSETANGTVDAVTATSLTISGSNPGGGTFKQTYTIDASTKVIGVGAGTAAAAKGGKMAITDYVGVGDRVSVTYHKMGDTIHAGEVRVRSKAR